MQKTGFTEALDQVVAADPRYDREAYLFLQDALDFTMKSRKKQKADATPYQATNTPAEMTPRPATR